MYFLKRVFGFSFATMIYLCMSMGSSPQWNWAAIIANVNYDPLCSQSSLWTSYRTILVGEPDLVKRSLIAENFTNSVRSTGQTLGDVEPCLLGIMATLLYRVRYMLMIPWDHPDSSFRDMVALYADLYMLATSVDVSVYDNPHWGFSDEMMSTIHSSLVVSLRKIRTNLASTNVPRHDSVLRMHLRAQIDQRRFRDDALDWELSVEESLGQRPLPPRYPKVFTYEAGWIPGLAQLTRSPAFCGKAQWGSDVGFHDFFRYSPFGVSDPESADLFLVPGYASCHLYANKGKSTAESFLEISNLYKSSVPQLSYLGRSGGRDHLLPIHYVDLFGDWRDSLPHAMKLTPETEVGFEANVSTFPTSHRVDGAQPPFDIRKDASLPPYLDFWHIRKFADRGDKKILDRKKVAVFAGKEWSDIEDGYAVRNSLRRLYDRMVAVGNATDLFIHVRRSVRELLPLDNMADVMGDAKFCLIPRGRAAWSVRFYESLWSGCVPVVLSDHFEIPFDLLFDVTKFIIKWPMNKVDESLIQYLRGIPDDVTQKLADEARAVRCWYAYPPHFPLSIGESAVWRSLVDFEEDYCPNLSSSRNSYMAVVELLRRRHTATKACSGQCYFYPQISSKA